MSIGEHYQNLKRKLQDVYSDGESEAISALVIEHFTSIKKASISSNKSGEVSASISAKIQLALESLLQHMPVQYVLEESWFYGLKFFVNEQVLIPRPETEELVQNAIHWLLSKEKKGSKLLAVLDIGTGSGCIPIAIKKHIPKALVNALEVSTGALDVARVNAINHNTTINFMEIDFLTESGWEKLETYDLIISNPPYIPINDKEKLDNNVIDWEPATALFVPENDPLLFYRTIAGFGVKHLREDGIIMFECHQDFAQQTLQLFEQEGYTTELKKDINGNERMLFARRSGKN